MSIPRTYKAFRRSSGDLPRTLELVTEELPSSLHPHEVLIRIHAVSLNYRDVAMLHGKYAVDVKESGIPASDCAAEVIAVGSEVKDFAVGDRVAPIFDLNNLTATEDEMAALGGDVDGVLRQFAVFDQKVLVHLPTHLSWEEAACITCAGATAWTALDMPESTDKGRVALLQGTGGVSMFALLICLAAGIRPIITSSSDQKLDIARSLGEPGAVDVINYRTHPKWEEEALRLTNGRGVDIVLENVGATTIAQSIASLARRGTASLVGFLGGLNPENPPNTVHLLLAKTAMMKGIAGGSKIDQQNLCRFLAEKKVQLQPILDEVFAFEDSNAAFDHLYAAKHMGKVIIKM
ncbi:alcohol dehydrogenase [Sphaerosporella brunnea]|uniref:Alcohol dehydrogenase n=1 Tax=Sphaerosporella brunnea TaxID=1250544 RepID=A0A5J5EKY2_9PEZI|nr:alcohol dehydrogenase [Sphaerosporella brunnea]KAA8895739.1 alcohol dehydrogenase [Sphaerosporella brunnea]